MHYRAILTLLALALPAIIASFADAKTASADTANAAFADGSHIVGQDITPGTYVAEIEQGICRVAITTIDDDQRQPTFLSRAIITISNDDNIVETTGCGDWRPRTPTDRQNITRQFGEGAHEIGVDMPTGIYTADGNDGRCLWFNLNDFSHHPDLNQQFTWWKVGKPVVHLSKDHVGFYSIRCGTWSLRETTQNEKPLTQFADGSHLVGIDIAPGVYVADTNDAFCNWFRTAPFGGANSDNSGGYRSQGSQIAEILPTDTGFYSDGCGIWKPFADQDIQSEPTTVIGAGTHAVGIDIHPGAYVAEATDGQLCRWFFLSGFAGRASDIATSGVGVLRGITEIPATVAGFRSIGCGEWSMIQNSPTTQTTTAFGDGEHVVNVHIKPGIYLSPGPATGRCSWRRITSYAGASADHVAVRNPVGRNIAEITENDAIFKSFGCGTWQPFDPSTQMDNLTSFNRGTWAINYEVVPGTYTAQAPDGSTCFWSRLSAFTGEPEDFATTNNSVGHTVMTVHHFDTGFYSDGCGSWTVVTPESSEPDPKPKTEFQDGTYINHRQVAPGTYIADGIDGEVCFWSRLTGFDGDIFNRINLYASAGQAIATILKTDQGFRSFGCGTWQRLEEYEHEVPPAAINADESSDGHSITSDFSDGTYRIGIDIDPGTYIASGSNQTRCRWRRLSDFTWTSGVTHEAVASGNKIVTLKHDDIGFASLGCGEWALLDVGSIERPETPPTRFGGGSYLVGIHIEPGTYYAVPPPHGNCRWSRVTDFTGDPSDTLASGLSSDRWVVTIDPEDIGFVTIGCSLWRNINIALAIGPFEKFDDGVYRVGEDIVPGTYVTDVPNQPFIGGRPVPSCKWERLAGFSHTHSHVIESGGGKGKIEVTISEADVGFQAQGCGEWRKTR